MLTLHIFYRLICFLIKFIDFNDLKLLIVYFLCCLLLFCWLLLFLSRIIFQRAKKAIQGLNNRLVFKRKLQVRWAHEQEISEKPAPAALTTSLTAEPHNTNSKIAE